MLELLQNEIKSCCMFASLQLDRTEINNHTVWQLANNLFLRVWQMKEEGRYTIAHLPLALGGY
jgi:hypothetical protein